MKNTLINLGQTVTDKITGFSGIVTGYVTYISGCNQALVMPKVCKEGKLQEGQWIDEQRLVVNTRVKSIKLDNSRARGFDCAPPKR